jgi:hypothetical protein
VQGGGDLITNIGAPSTSVVIGGGGGSLLGNKSMAPNAARWVAGDTTSTIVGVCVGLGLLTLYMAKNGFQYVPASTEAWITVDTDADIEMYITMPTVPATAFNLILGDGIDVKANAGSQSTRLLSSGDQIGNDPTAAGFVAEVTFNKTRHARGTGAFVAD